jgi:hypothetical protein
MWESRGLCEISKRRWKSVCDFHGRAISIAVPCVEPAQPSAHPTVKEAMRSIQRLASPMECIVPPGSLGGPIAETAVS